MIHRTVGVALGVIAVAVVAAIGAVALAGTGGGDESVTLRDAGGAERGSVSFERKGDGTEVRVRLAGLPESVAREAFHGFHIHANGDPSNGEGCVADATKPSNTWFVSADGHWKADGQNHAGHLGDMPSVLVMKDGKAEMRFETSRIDRAQLKGKAVILHAGPDNFGNVPVGTSDTQYTANKDAAVTATQNTGNAGDRILCGVVG